MFQAPEPLPQQQTDFLPQQPSPLGPQQQDVPQTINSNAPQPPFPPEMNQAPAYNDPGQPMAPDGEYIIIQTLSLTVFRVTVRSTDSIAVVACSF